MNVNVSINIHQTSALWQERNKKKEKIQQIFREENARNIGIFQKPKHFSHAYKQLVSHK